jgi:hypothetical protein
MDGILEAVLRLEDAKRVALIAFDSSSYDKYLRAQLCVIRSLTPEILSGFASENGLPSSSTHGWTLPHIHSDLSMEGI